MGPLASLARPPEAGGTEAVYPAAHVRKRTAAFHDPGVGEHRKTMPTRGEVTELLDTGHTYATAATELGISPGLTFMIATGVPADRSSTSPVAERRRELPGSTQDLIGPPAFNPTQKVHVLDWVKARAARELTDPTPKEET